MELKKLHRLPNIDQKLPILAIQKPIAEIINRIQPIKFILLFDILFEIECFNL
jgi:hypothetical protein